MDADLESYWELVGPSNDRVPDSEQRVTHRRILRPNWEPASSDILEAWVRRVGEDGQRPIVLVEGPTPAHRQALYRLAGIKSKDLDADWVGRGVVEELTERFSRIRCTGSIAARPWDIIWNLLTLEELVAEDSLKDLIDQGLTFTQAHKAIWEARFLLDEGKDIRALVDAFTAWVTAQPLTSEAQQLLSRLGIERELSTPFERLDMLFFLAALASQNHLIGSQLFVLDGLDRAVVQGTARRRELLKELDHFCTSADRWSKLGAPIGFVLGYSNEHKAMAAIEKSNAKLAAKLQRYLSV